MYIKTKLYNPILILQCVMNIKEPSTFYFRSRNTFDGVFATDFWYAFLLTLRPTLKRLVALRVTTWTPK